MNFVITTTAIFALIHCNLLDAQPSNSSTKWNPEEIKGYHFHTYFFQDNEEDKASALNFR